MEDVQSRTTQSVPSKKSSCRDAEIEFAGYSGCYPPYGKYIEGRFSQGRKRAEDIVGSIMMEGFIAQMNTPFKVNLQQIKETHGYVPIYSNPQGDKERTKQGATAIIYPPLSMSVPPPTRMNMPPPKMHLQVPDYSVAPPQYRRDEPRVYKGDESYRIHEGLFDPSVWERWG